MTDRYTGDLPVGSWPRAHDFARWIGTWLFRPIYRLRFHHRDRVPAQGPVVVVANHSAFVDGPLLFGQFGRRRRFRPRVDVLVGEPITLPQGSGRAGLGAATETIRAALVGLVADLDELRRTT